MNTQQSSSGTPTPPPLPQSSPQQIVIYAGPRGRVWKYIALILFLLLLFSGVGNLEWWTAGPKHHWFRETWLKDENASQKAVLYSLTGLLYGGYVGIGKWNPVRSLTRALQQAQEDPEVQAVLLRIDSPGGEILAVEEMYQHLREFQSKTGKPVIAYLDGTAASGGYYVASACRWIVAHEMTMTGSIGVILHTYNYRGLLDKIGVEPLVFKSGKFKDILRGDKRLDEILPEERKMIQAIVDDGYQMFLDRVQTGRTWAREMNQGQGRKLSPDWKQYADGRILLGKEAYQLGFVDELGDFETAWKRVKKMVGTGHLNLVQYTRPGEPGILSLLDLSATRATSPRSLKVEVSLPQRFLRPGVLYALWMGGYDPIHQGDNR